MRRINVGWSLVVLTGLFSLAGCIDDSTDGLPVEPIDETPKPTRYGALGNSLTAGFINGGLIAGGQVASYPMVIAAQAGWDTPSLPIIDSPGLGSPNAQGIPQSAISISKTGGLVTENVFDPIALLLNGRLPWPYDNLGIPGATTLDMLNAKDAGTSQAGNNLFFDLILRNSAVPPGTFTPLDAMTARNPRALTVWIGNNDILGGALGGNPSTSGPGANITPPLIWEAIFVQVADRIDAMNAEYVSVANVPNIVDIPYVTTIPAAFDVGGGNFLPFNTVEEDVRYVLLPFGLLLASNPDTVQSFLTPGGNEIPSNWTLTADEATLITNTAISYAAVIERECAARGWGYVDASSELAALPNNIAQPNLGEINGLFPWLPQFSPGGVSFIRNALSAFSLDGVHPSEIGQGLIANAFIRSFNETYSLGITEVDLATISNEVGFEDAPGFSGNWETESRSVSDMELGRSAIENMPQLLGLGQ